MDSTISHVGSTTGGITTKGVTGDDKKAKSVFTGNRKPKII